MKTDSVSVARCFSPRWIGSPRRIAKPAPAKSPRSLTLSLALTLAPISCAIGFAASVEPRDVDALFAAWNKPDTPGVALAVIRDGQIIYERSYGQADLEAKAAITPKTSFYIGSVSKQFAAAAIALLHQRKVISLDDDVRKYVPELPDYGTPITIRQCVHHTSGLRDYLGLRDLAGEDPNATFGDDYVLALLQKQKALNFPPGSRHLYSNSGYFLLSLIVKRASGKSLRDFAAENIFAPLGMKTAQFRDRHDHPIPNRANGYSAAGTAYRVNNPNFDVVGAGGVFMTTRDYLAWDQNFYSPKVGDRSLITLLETPGRLNDGTVLTYAFGLQVGRYRGLDIVEHAGAYGGFRAHAMRFPAQRFSVVCFTNLSSQVPSRLARQVADLYLASAFTTPAATEATVATATKAGSTAKRSFNAPTDFAGTYFSEELGVSYRISADPATLALTLHPHRRPAARLVPVADHAFTAGSSRVSFQHDSDNRAVSFVVDDARARGIVFTRQ